MASLLNALPGAIAQGLIWGIMSIGVYITYKVLDLADLTVDGSLCTGGAVCVMMMISGAPMWLALLLSVIVGMLTGFITGMLHTALGIPAILSGILTQLSLYSINLRILGDKANQAINVNNYDLLVSLRYIEQTIITVIIVIAILVLVLFWFFSTEVGASIRATGSNETMAKAYSINTNLAKIVGLMLSNGIVALSGALLSQYNGFVDVQMGRGAIVIGLASVIISQVVLGRFINNFALKLGAVCVGSIIYYVVIQVVISLKLLSTNDLKLLSAVIVAVFLAIPHLQEKYFKKAGVK